MAAALRAGGLTSFDARPTVADGLAGGVEQGSVTFTILQRGLESMVTVTEAEIAEAVAWAFSDEGLLLEGSGAVGIAAIRNGSVPIAGTTVVLLTGRNVTPSLYARLLTEGTDAIEAAQRR
jgi:threonine dehydratase